MKPRNGNPRTRRPFWAFWGQRDFRTEWGLGSLHYANHPGMRYRNEHYILRRGRGLRDWSARRVRTYLLVRLTQILNKIRDGETPTDDECAVWYLWQELETYRRLYARRCRAGTVYAGVDLDLETCIDQALLQVELNGRLRHRLPLRWDHPDAQETVRGDSALHWKMQAWLVQHLERSTIRRMRRYFADEIAAVDSLDKIREKAREEIVAHAQGGRGGIR